MSDGGLYTLCSISNTVNNNHERGSGTSNQAEQTTARSFGNRILIRTMKRALLRSSGNEASVRAETTVIVALRTCADCHVDGRLSRDW